MIVVLCAMEKERGVLMKLVYEKKIRKGADIDFHNEV